MMIGQLPQGVSQINTKQSSIRSPQSPNTTKEAKKIRTDCYLFHNTVLSRMIDSSTSTSVSAATRNQSQSQNQNRSQTGAQIQTHDQSAYPPLPVNRPSAARRGPPIITDGSDRYASGSTPMAQGQGQGQQRNHFGPIYPVPLRNTNNNANTNRGDNNGGNGTAAGEGDDNDVIVSFLPSPPRLFDSDGDSLHSLTDDEEDDGNRVYGDGGDAGELWDEVEWMREVLDGDHASGTGAGISAGAGAGAGTRNERPFPLRRPGLGSTQADGTTGQGADLQRGGFNRRRDYLDFLDHMVNLPNNSSIPGARTLTQDLLDSLNSNRFSQTLHTRTHVQDLINDNLNINPNPDPNRNRNTSTNNSIGSVAEGQVHGISRPLEYALNISRSSSRAESRAAGLSPTNVGPVQAGVQPPVLVSSTPASSSRLSRGRRARSAGPDLDVDGRREGTEGERGENSPARKRSRTSACSSSSASSSLNDSTGSALSSSSSGASSSAQAQSRQQSGPARHFRPPYLSYSSFPVDTLLPLDLGFPQPPSSAHLTLSSHIHRPSPILAPAPLATAETEMGAETTAGSGRRAVRESENIPPRPSIAPSNLGYPAIRPRITFSHPRPTRTDSDATSLMTTLPVPRGVGIFYWEAEVLAKGEEGFISVGWIAGLPTPIITPGQKDVNNTNVNASGSGSGSRALNANTIPNTGGAGGHAGVPMRNMRRLVGWSKGSWGWHGDDGRLFAGQGMGERFSETWGGTSSFHLFPHLSGRLADLDGHDRG